MRYCDDLVSSFDLQLRRVGTLWDIGRRSIMRNVSQYSSNPSLLLVSRLQSDVPTHLVSRPVLGTILSHNHRPVSD